MMRSNILLGIAAVAMVGGAAASTPVEEPEQAFGFADPIGEDEDDLEDPDEELEEDDLEDELDEEEFEESRREAGEDDEEDEEEELDKQPPVPDGLLPEERD